MRFDPHGPGVVLSPHPDDAVLSAWAVLSSAQEIVVVTLCTALPPSSEPGTTDPIFGVTDAVAFMRRRLREDATALAMAGRVGVPLGFLDGQYREEPLDPASVRVALDGAVETASFLFAPAAIGGHPDHVVTRQVGLEAARDGGIPLSLYADLPYAVHAGWPHWVTGLPPRPNLVPEARWASDLRAAALAPASLTPRVVVLGDGEAARKLGAMQAYESQFAALNGGPLNRLGHEEILGWELAFDVSFS